MFFTIWGSNVPFLSLGVSSKKLPSEVPFIVLVLKPFLLFDLPPRTSLAIWDSTSASSAASVSCLISGAKSPSLPVSFFPFLNWFNISFLCLHSLWENQIQIVLPSSILDIILSDWHGIYNTHHLINLIL